MPRVCVTCAHPQRAEINQLLVSGSGSIRSIAAQFEVAESSLKRHARDHVPKELSAAASVARENESGSLLERVRRLYTAANNILSDAQAGKDQRLALLALDRLAKLLSVEGAALVALAEKGETEKSICVTWTGVCPQCPHCRQAREVVIDAVALPAPEKPNGPDR